MRAHTIPRRAGGASPRPSVGLHTKRPSVRRTAAVESPPATTERGGKQEGAGGPPTPSPQPTACSSLLAGPPSPLLYPDLDPLPPASRPLAIAELVLGALWTFTVPFYASPISKLSAENRMTVARVEGVGLVAFNPLTPTQPLLDGLAALEKECGATVRAIVIPSTSPEHWVGGAGLAAAFPAAAVLAPPGFFSAGPGGGRIGGKLGALASASAVLDAAAAAGRATEVEVPAGGGPTALWGGQVEAAVFQGKGGFCEATFYLASSRTVLTADLAFGLSSGDLAATPGANWLDALLSRVAGIHGKLGCATWPVLRASPGAAAAFVAALDGWVAGPGVDKVVPAHLSAPWGGEALEGAFAFVRKRAAK